MKIYLVGMKIQEVFNYEEYFWQRLWKLNYGIKSFLRFRLHYSIGGIVACKMIVSVKDHYRVLSFQICPGCGVGEIEFGDI